MQRIIFRHLSGSKANQVEEFQADSNNEFIFGRDDAAQVKYDPARDDLVSRQHAKIVADPSTAGGYILEDLSSRNGTFLNKQRMTGRAAITPGDIVQFGAGGPEFQFDLDPRPSAPARTREASISTAVGAPATREGASLGGGMVGGNNSIPSSGPSSEPVKTTVGKATVERMIGDTRKQGQKMTLFVGLAGLGLLVLVGGYFAMKSARTETAVNNELGAARNQIADTNSRLSDADAKLKEQQANAPMAPTQIVAQNSAATARIEVGWKLIYTRTGNQVYHQTVVNPKDKKEYALFVQVGQTLEPQLTTTPNNHPIGGEGTGSGFAVSSDGFMLTNRHVAASWKTSYHFSDYVQQSLLVGQDGKTQPLSPQQIPIDWVPAETQQAGQSLMGGFEGRNDYLYATFPGQDTRVPMRLGAVSEKHDVALVKIDTPGTVSKVDLNDNYDTIKPGDGATVLGYPGLSPSVYGVVRSQDEFNRTSHTKIIPDPTVSVGNIGRILRGNDGMDKSKMPTFSQSGDFYQLTINSTGGGNSGGPVFDSKGRVIAIFSAGTNAVGGNITFAVPIRYGMELMNVTGGSSSNSSSTDASSSATPATVASATNTSTSTP